MFEILEKKQMAQGTVCMFRLKAPRIARKTRPGQFVILRANERGERIPLTVAETHPEQGWIRIYFQVVGKTTAMLARMAPGEIIQDVIGPLGVPTHVDKVGTVICVGGGLGVAVIYPITRAFFDAGNHVIAIIGARTKELLILEQEMNSVCHELHVTTDDGSYGRHGFVTDVLKELLEQRKDVGMVMGIGPVPMMRFLCKTTQPFGVKTMVSLNPIMVDGTGMCGACRVRVGGQTRFCCVHGPDFDGHQVDFEELSKRLMMYVPQERESYQRFQAEVAGGSSR
ncbi:MAG: sulfide/dihydroorotate dehydrogenase-like FAD/NAD-binding protein [bacterium]